MSEMHSYGTSLGCVSRRYFIMIFCFVFSLVCVARIAQWFFHLNIFNDLMGTEYLPTEACQGIECYEVFSCRGFAWTTEHIREPFTTVGGVIMFPLGVVACLHGYRDMLKLVATYLALIAIIYIVSLIGDVTYFETCSAYPGNMIEVTLLWAIPLPIRAGMQQQLERMRFFPQADVNKITNNFPTLSMYVVMQLFVCVALVYVAREARKLGMLFERGPIGLGVHYGLGQFDEILNHEAIKKLKEPKSFFVEDGQLPPYRPQDPAAPLGYCVGHDYGAFQESEEGQAEPVKKKSSKAPERFQERNQLIEEEAEAAREEYDGAERELAEAKEEMRKERQQEEKLEEKAQEKFRHAEEHKEQHEEFHAEHEAEEHAEEARNEALAEGKSAQEVAIAGVKAYQKTLAKHHRKMIENAQTRTMHEHYRHSEREKLYHDMENSATRRVKDAEAAVQQARAKLERAAAAKRAVKGQGPESGLGLEAVAVEGAAPGGEEAEPMETVTIRRPLGSLPGGAMRSPVELGPPGGPMSMPLHPAMGYPQTMPPMGRSMPNMLVSGPPPPTPPVHSASTAHFGGSPPTSLGGAALGAPVPSSLLP